jgi:hypothetical protein
MPEPQLKKAFTTGHRGHGEKTEKKLWVNKQGSVISTRVN